MMRNDLGEKREREDGLCPGVDGCSCGVVWATDGCGGQESNWMQYLPTYLGT